MNDTSGVGVLDKAVSVLAAAESGPATLAQLVDATGLARPTAHRIAVALERHRLLGRDAQGRFVLGPRIAELASAAVAVSSFSGSLENFVSLASRGVAFSSVCMSASMSSVTIVSMSPSGPSDPSTRLTSGSPKTRRGPWSRMARTHAS